ncbi:hypothetical protein FH972_026365 [Carpinus fangiana]|uniref:AB hydrolase-1 domain-containing protein n=1 Tax=Carpinus fangiana TaxID=176857 RepID=A0A5N6L448_9ROSI|nr:hypothetical protein FH972_026365 [Carpinus fangiana]
MSTSIPSVEGSVDFRSYKTWYRITGSLTSGVTPLICVHGGPGACSDYLWPLQELASSYNIPVVVYDQVGNGRSSHMPEKVGDESFWTEELFKEELANLIDKLGLRAGGYHLLGQSWGGMLCSAFASERPAGLRKLIISNSPASMPLWLEACNKLRNELPQDVQETLLKHEKEDTTDSDEYKAAVEVFYYRHLCRVKPFPALAKASLDWIEKDPTVYHTMNGPSEFHVIGSLKTWSVIDRLHKIEVPTLVLNGKYDEAQDSCVVPYFKEIPKAKWIVLDNSSHMAMFEEPERYQQVVAEFLLW